MYIIEGVGLGSLGMTVSPIMRVTEGSGTTGSKAPFVSQEAADQFFAENGLTQTGSGEALDVGKQTDWTKYIVWGAVGLTALIVLWMAFKK